MIAATLSSNTFHVPVYVIVLVALLAVVLLVSFVLHCRNSPKAIVSRDLLFRRPFLAATLYNSHGVAATGTG